jgi:Family of unknown function (DUF5906)
MTDKEDPHTVGDAGAKREDRNDGADSKPTSPKWKALPTKDAYLSRIGAEERNFRTWIVKREGEDGYHADVAVIRVVDGKIVVRDKDKEFAPTEEERAAIEAEIAAANWPRSIAARETDDLRDLLKADGVPNPELYEFRNFQNKDSGILFVQQRVRKKNGSKADYPWSFWSDGKWRQMEPDCPDGLPLFGLEQLHLAAAVFLHEGAACASAVRAKGFIDAHPWALDLGGAVHLGWPGGAPNPDRVDWSPIRNLPPHVHVFIVCDNDKSGIDAAPLISLILKRRCWALQFGGMFPEHFDLANPFPDRFFTEKDGRRIYTGPSFESCLVPATWATRTRTEDDKVQFELRYEFASDWLCVTSPAVFIHRDYLNRQYSEEEFNSKVRPYSHGKANVADLLKKCESSKAETLVYEPALPGGRIAMEGLGLVANVYRPSTIKPVMDYKEGEDQPWLEFVEHLLPNKIEREHTYKILATLIARPDIRIRYGLLLLSLTQGVGKGTLGEKILKPIIGDHNTSVPSENEIVDGNYNYWAVHKRLVVVHEIYAGQSAKAYNKLKSYLTDDTIPVLQKYVANYQTKNHLFAVAMSNSMRALKLAQEDRRWFVPEVTEVKRDQTYWKRLNLWLTEEGGRGIIAGWAHRYVAEHGIVEDGEHPPMTARKTDVIESAFSLGEQLAYDLGENFAEFIGPLVMRADKLLRWISDKKEKYDPQKYHNGKLLESYEKINNVMRSRGLYMTKKQFRDEITRIKFRLFTNFKIVDEAKAFWVPPPKPKPWEDTDPPPPVGVVLKSLCQEPEKFEPF